MPSLSVSLEQAEDVLNDVLRIIMDDYAGPHCALDETERKNIMEEEISLRGRIKETNDSMSTSPIYSLVRRLINLPQARQCLEDAKKLRMRVKDKISERRRSTLTGRGSLFGPSMGGQTADGRLPVDDTSGSANEMVTSPLNMQCSVPEFPESNVDAFEDGSDFRIDMNEAMCTPIRPSNRPGMSDFDRDIQPGRISPSLPIQRVGQSNISDTPRPSHSFRGFPRPSSQSMRQSNMTNCVTISNSNVTGPTLNNGGKNNSGSVNHMVLPQHLA